MWKSTAKISPAGWLQTKAIRKNSGFEITDKIHLVLSKNPNTDDAVKEYNTYICNQVLANSLELSDEVPGGVELNFDDFTLYVKVSKL